MFVRQTQIVQLLLLSCIVIQSCLLHDVGSSFAPLKAESEPPSEDATTNDEDHYEMSWTTDTSTSRPSGCRPRCLRETSNTSKDQKTNIVEYILRRRKRRSVESDDQERDYARGEIFRATNERNRTLEEEVGHFFDDVDGLVSDSEDHDAPDTLPNEEVPVAINCKEVPIGSKDWECFRKTLIQDNRRKQSRYTIGGTKLQRNTRSEKGDNDNPNRQPVYVSLDKCITDLIKLKDEIDFNDFIRELIKLKDEINSDDVIRKQIKSNDDYTIGTVRIDSGYSKVSSANIMRPMKS